jgi:hypothetical protein
MLLVGLLPRVRRRMMSNIVSLVADARPRMLGACWTVGLFPRGNHLISVSAPSFANLFDRLLRASKLEFKALHAGQGVSEMERNVRIPKRRRLILQQCAPDLLEQFVELLWLREQVRRAETLDPERLLAEFKAHRGQTTTKARRSIH